MDAERTQDEPFRILFVCTGNTCRSPLAEAIARRALEERGWSHVVVDSAGVAAFPGAPASSGARRAAERHGLDVSGHMAKPLTPALVADTDLILAMSPGHLAGLERRELDRPGSAGAGAGDRATLLTTYAAAEDPDGVPEAVSDPFGGSDDDYEATFLLLERLVERALRRLKPGVTR